MADTLPGALMPSATTVTLTSNPPAGLLAAEASTSVHEQSGPSGEPLEAQN